jgi:hypothetical protein
LPPFPTPHPFSTLSSDACQISPARVPGVVTVAASDAADACWPQSNAGACVDLVAPGAAVRSAAHFDADAMVVASGTSMAAPLVSGAAALALGADPGAPPAAVVARLLADATPDAVIMGDGGGAAALLHVPPRRGDGGGAAPKPPPVDLAPAALAPVFFYQGAPQVTANDSLTLTNKGDAPVSWRARAAPRGLVAGWLAVSPLNGTLAPGEAISIAVRYDVSGAQFQGTDAADVVVAVGSPTDPAAPPTVLTRAATALVFCGRLAGAGNAGDRKLERVVLADAALDRPQGWPPAAPGGGDPAPDDGATLYATLTLTLSHPVPEAPGGGWLTVDGRGSIADVHPGGGRGALCAEYATRVAVPVDPWAGKEVEICVAGAARAVVDAWGTPFPAFRACVRATTPPRAALLAPLAIGAGGGGLEFGGASLLVLLATSVPPPRAPAPTDFALAGPPGARVASVTPVPGWATRFHAVVELPPGFAGAVRVSLAGGAGACCGAAPAPPLVATRVRAPLARGTGYRLLPA